jgi:hypothetical protein
MVRSGSITCKKALVRISAFPELTLLLLLVFARAAVAAPGSREPSRAASRPCGFDPSRRITSRSPEALALGSRRHFIPASLSLPRARVPF